jgi:GNAT superfamily N-acetyltransferase
MEIRQITFEEILPYWKKYLWSNWENISRVNAWTQKDYCYRTAKYFTEQQLVRIFKPVYAACFIDDDIVGVESGYETNFDHYRIRGLWVDKNHRRKGIATELVRYFECLSTKRYIWSIPRETALDFYLSYGFKVDGIPEKSTTKQNYFVIKERKCK